MFVNLEDTLHLQRKHFVADNMRQRSIQETDLNTGNNLVIFIQHYRYVANYIAA